MACAASPSSATGPSTPGRHRIAVDHRVLERAVRLPDQRRARRASPRSSPSKWCAKSSIATCRNQPLCFQPSALSIVTSAIQLIIDEAGLRIGMRDRIEHDALAMRAEADEGRAGADRLRPGGAAPHDRAAPVDRRLGRDASAPGPPSGCRRRRSAARRSISEVEPSACSISARHAAVGILAVAGHAAAEPAPRPARSAPPPCRAAACGTGRDAPHIAASCSRRAARAARNRCRCR